MSVRDFKKGATLFFETMATFTSTELMDYRTFVKYAVFSCLVAKERSDIKTEVRCNQSVSDGTVMSMSVLLRS